MKPAHAKKGSGHFFYNVPLLLAVALTAGLPLGWLAWQVLLHPAALAETSLNSFRLRLLARTLLYNGAVAAIATLLAFPVAVVLGRGRGIVARALFFTLPVSLLLPSLTYAYGWSQFLRLLRIWFEPAGFADVLRCIWSLATWLWPIPAAVMGLALRRMDTQVQQHALLDGAYWRITLRQLAGAMAASAAIAAVLAMQEFSVYEPTGISVVATEVRMVFETGAFSSPDNLITAVVTGQSQPLGPGGGGGDQSARAAAAVAAALPLLVFIGLISACLVVVVRRARVEAEIDAGPWPQALSAGAGWKAASIAIVIVTVFVPTISLLASLRRFPNPIRLWQEFSPQMIGSISIAAITGLLALALGFWATVRQSRLSLFICVIAFLIGGQILAIALIRLYNRPSLEWVYNGPLIVIGAYLARFFWVALFAAGTTSTPTWRPLRDLASVDGAGPLRTATSVIWPLAWPVLLAGAILIAALSLVEVPATVLLSPQRPQMLTPLMMTWVHMLRYDAMIEASLLLMGSVGSLGLLVAALIRKTQPRAAVLHVSIGLLLLLVGALGGCDRHAHPQAIWCSTGTGPAQVVYPRAISYSQTDDSFFIIDRMARVQHLDNRGRALGEWRMPEWQQGKPVGVSIGPDGNVYVPDTHYHRVMVYSPAGELLRQWGARGTAPGEFIYPTDIAFDSKGNVFVSEYGDNDRIQVFNPQGKFLYQFGHFGSGDGEFSRPQSIIIDRDTLYITDACNHRIAVFKTDGTFIRNMGSTGSALGQFRFPYGLDEDRDGHLIVCEFGNNRVQLIDKETGRGLAAWGAGGHEPGQLAYPWGVAVDKNNRIVAVDAGNNRLQVFRF